MAPGGKRPRGLVVAAPASSSGKTVFTLGFMEALKRRGVAVQPFKAGPDYIDAGLHSALLERPSYNLDTWMMGPQAVKRTYSSLSAEADVSIVEGVMGLFDGAAGERGLGSTADLSKLLGLPVLLVVDAGKAAQSVGAVIKGFESYDAGVDLRWVVFNRVASERHYRMLCSSMPRGTKVRVLGYLPKDEGLAVPQRHLGLHTASTLSRARWQAFTERACAAVRENVDVEAVLKATARPKRGGHSHGAVAPRATEAASGGVRIAVALDRAFCFYYEENLDILRGLGATLVPFSPIRDRGLPEDIHGAYIGGGYPELFARALEGNVSMRKEVRDAARAGLPMLAECGGLVYLGKSMEDTRGRPWAGAGVFPWKARFSGVRAALGYREVSVQRGCPLFKRGGRVRGHEFHYSSIPAPPARLKRAFRTKAGGDSGAGYLYKNTLASYVHLHFASNPAFAAGFVKACSAWKKELKSGRRY